VAALVRSQNAGFTAAETVARLTETAEDLGAGGRDDQFGQGLVRADRALGANAPPPVEPPSGGDTPTVPGIGGDGDDSGTISNTGGSESGGTSGGSGVGMVSASGGLPGVGDSGAGAGGSGRVSRAARRATRGGSTGGAAGSGDPQSSALPNSSVDQNGEPARVWRDPFTIALIAVVVFAGVGLWRLRARRSANS
jgi:hypothetical protein